MHLKFTLHQLTFFTIKKDIDATRVTSLSVKHVIFTLIKCVWSKWQMLSATKSEMDCTVQKKSWATKSSCTHLSILMNEEK